MTGKGGSGGMTTLIPDNFETVAPSDADVLLARKSSHRLASHAGEQGAAIQIQLMGDQGQAETVPVPASVLRLLVRMLAEMGQGHAVTLIPTQAELTTQQAADLLHVSRPYVVKLLDEGKIPGRTVGKYRRIRLEDLLVYKQKDDAARARILDQLTAEAQELGMGY